MRGEQGSPAWEDDGASRIFADRNMRAARYGARSNAASGRTATTSAAATITDLVVELGVTARTLRHWEACGLLRPRRTARGERIYDPVERGRARIIGELRRLEAPLPDIERLLAAGLDAEDSRRFLARFLRKRAEIAEARARRARDALARLEAGRSPLDPDPDAR